MSLATESESLPPKQFILCSFVLYSSSQPLVHAQSLQKCLTLCAAMDSSPPGSSVHGILQARILLPCPPPGDLPDPVIEPSSPAASALHEDSLLISYYFETLKIGCYYRFFFFFLQPVLINYYPISIICY